MARRRFRGDLAEAWKAARTDTLATAKHEHVSSRALAWRYRGMELDTRPGKDVFPQLSHAIIGCAMRVHSALGPGMLEAVYEECLGSELTGAGIVHQRQVRVPISYRGRQFDCGYRLDILVERKVVVEVKAIDQLLPVHECQLYTYMRMSSAPLGLLINFNVPHLRQGVRRRVFTGRRGPPLPT